MPQSKLPLRSGAALCRTAFLILAFALAAAGSALADEQKTAFDVPAGNASQTLKRFAQQAGRQIVYNADAVRDVQTSAVEGEYTVPEAINRLLAGTNLHALMDMQTGALAVNSTGIGAPAPEASAPATAPESPGAGPVAAPAAASEGETAGRPAPIPVEPGPPPTRRPVAFDKVSAETGAYGEQTIRLSPFEVTDTNDHGYGSRYQEAGSRINTATMNEPMAIVSVNQEMMRDINPDTPTDVLQYVSGVNASNTTVRGFQQNTLDFRDGLPDHTGESGSDYQDETIIERIEVVKGPAGVEFGATSLGGVINFISKKPLPYNQLELQGTVGSFDTYRGVIDANAVAGDHNQLRVRVIADYQDGKVYLGGVNNRTDIDPMFYYYVNPATYFWFRLDYNHTRQAWSLTSWIVDAAGNTSTFLPYRNPLENLASDVEEDSRTKYEVGFVTSFPAFGTTWNMRLVGRDAINFLREVTDNLSGIQFYNSTGQLIATGTQPAGVFTNPAWTDIQLTRILRWATRNPQNANVNLDFAALYDWGATRDQISLYSYLGYFAEDSVRRQYAEPNQDVFHPIEWADVWSHVTFTNDAILSTARSDYFANGLQDNLQLFHERLVLVGGVRDDWGWTQTNNKLIATNLAVTGGSGSDLTRKYGAIFKVIPGFGVYADHSETFTPQVGFLNNNPDTPLKDLRGIANEEGVKLELFDGRLTGVASVFNDRLTNNLFVPPAINGVVQPTIQEGTITTKGWESDMAYTPIPSISMILAYGNLTSKDVNGLWQRAVDQGANYKGLVKYTFFNGPLRGFAIGAGYVYDGPRAGNTGDTFNFPGYGKWNGFLTYTHANWRAQLNGANITSTKYETAASNNQEVGVGPLCVLNFTFTYTFR